VPGDRQGERVTLATIAEELGVSRMTVSNAYNRPEKLSAELRERVLATAKRRGYSGPDPLAATLRRGRVGAVGLLFDDPLPYAFTDPAAVLFFAGITAVCEQARVGLVLVPSRYGKPAETDLTRTALVDGFIGYCDIADDGRLDIVEERGLPLVIADGPPREAARWVGIDDRGAARLAAEHLLERGHRDIGIVALPFSPDGYEGPADLERQAAGRYWCNAQRLAGVREAFEAAGLDWSAVPIEERAPHGRDAGRRAAAALLQRPDRPTALLAMSDELAIGALQVAPDVSIIGFDDTPAAAEADLTTIAQPHREKGETAARMLLEPDAVPARVVLPTRLVERAST
jgi:DNA-binding LacI/PurR family transcriptional regulator